MSTQINVTVGKAGLSDQAKRQTAANRQAKLEADARIKAAAEGKRQRDANRAQRGVGPDGKLLFGKLLQAPARRDEPAAFRLLQKGWGILLVPDAERTVPDILSGKTKGSNNSNFCERFFANAYLDAPKVKAWGTDPGASYNSPVPFDVVAGPADSKAIKLPVDTMPAGMPSGDVRLNSYGRLTHCNETPVAAVGYSTVVTQNGTAYPWQVLDFDGVIKNATSNLIGSDTTDLTLEFIFKLGDDPVIGSRLNTTYLYLYLDVTDQPSALSGITRYLTMYSEFDWFSDNDAGSQTGYFAYNGDIYLGNGSASDYKSISVSQRNGSEQGIAEPKFLMGDWVHVAMVKTQKEFTLYVNGVSRGSVSLEPPSINPAVQSVALGEAFSQPLITLEIYAETEWSSIDPLGRPLPIWVHGVRATNKALYTASFTPPTTITTLA